MHAIHFTVVVHACNGAALAVVVALRSLMRRIVKVLGAQNSAFSHTFPSIAVRAPNARHTRIQSLPSFFVMLCSVRAVVASSLLGGKSSLCCLHLGWVGRLQDDDARWSTTNFFFFFFFFHVKCFFSSNICTLIHR